MEWTCVDLFSGSGGFSAAFADSDNWDVFRVDNRPETDADLIADMMDVTPADLPSGDVFLVGHPCTYFSTAGNHEHWNHELKEPITDDSRRHVAMVYHSIGLVKAHAPEFWFLENPRARLRWILGQPEGTVTYCQYGTEYQKPTDLWGNHPITMEYRSCKKGRECHVSNTDDDGSQATASMPTGYDERAAVPYGLSESIRIECEKWLRDQPEITECHD